MTYVFKKAPAGVLAGFPFLPIDLGKLIAFKQAVYDANVSYGFGSKDPHPGSGKVGFSEIDCSGFVRTLLMYAAGAALKDFPDGSYTQGDWLDSKGFKPTDASNGGSTDGCLRCYVHHPDFMDETGHIWLTVNGHTIESCGGRGPCERAWNTPLHSGHTLDALASVGYVLAALPQVKAPLVP